jgi:hypothetical protein
MRIRKIGEEDVKEMVQLSEIQKQYKKLDIFLNISFLSLYDT